MGLRSPASKRGGPARSPGVGPSYPSTTTASAVGRIARWSASPRSGTTAGSSPAVRSARARSRGGVASLEDRPELEDDPDVAFITPHARDGGCRAGSSAHASIVAAASHPAPRTRFVHDGTRFRESAVHRPPSRGGTGSGPSSTAHRDSRERPPRATRSSSPPSMISRLRSAPAAERETTTEEGRAAEGSWGVQEPPEGWAAPERTAPRQRQQKPASGAFCEPQDPYGT